MSRASGPSDIAFGYIWPREKVNIMAYAFKIYLLSLKTRSAVKTLQVTRSPQGNIYHHLGDSANPQREVYFELQPTNVSAITSSAKIQSQAETAQISTRMATPKGAGPPLALTGIP